MYLCIMESGLIGIDNPDDNSQMQTKIKQKFMKLEYRI